MGGSVCRKRYVLVRKRRAPLMRSVGPTPVQVSLVEAKAVA
jgi:hypothetical protein